MRPRFARKSRLLKPEGAGKPGARCTRSLACKIKKHTSVVTTVTPERPGIPRTMVLTGYFVLSPVIRVLLTPSPADDSAGLTPTSRRQDHTTWHVRVTRRSSKAHPRPPHPAPRIVTIASRPLGRNGTVHRIIRNLDTVKSDSAIQKIILPPPRRSGTREPLHQLPHRAGPKGFDRGAF
jgi:hypothetical protein